MWTANQRGMGNSSHEIENEYLLDLIFPDRYKVLDFGNPFVSCALFSEENAKLPHHKKSKYSFVAAPLVSISRGVGYLCVSPKPPLFSQYSNQQAK